MAVTRLTTNGLNGTKYDIVSADNYYMEPIATTLLASSQATISFTNIPQGYKNLQIRGIMKSTTAGTSVNDVFFQFNGDTGSNYSTHFIAGTTAAGSGAAINQVRFRASNCAPYTGTANVFGAVVMDILDYSNVYKYKTARSLGGSDWNGTGYINMDSGLWMNTAAITSITIFPGANSFETYTRLSLFGIKG